MAKPSTERFARRFNRRVLLPGALILLITGALCGAALFAAGRSTDDLSLEAQQAQVWGAISDGLDALSLAQESIGFCEACLMEATSVDPDTTWLNEQIGGRLFSLYGAEETYILDASNRPILASVEGKEVAPSAYERVAPSLEHLVALARGEAERPSGRGNLNERLPGATPEPLVLPPQPGVFEESFTLFPTVRTSPDIVHATDLVRVGEEVALVSAMRMQRVDQTGSGAELPAPMLLSLRYLDEDFLAGTAAQYFLLDPRIANSVEPREGEAWIPLTNSDGDPLANIFWKPQLGGSIVISRLAAPAAGAFGIVALLLLMMALRMRRLLRRDEEHLAKIEEKNVKLRAKEAQAHHLAYHDVLTGLPNRALFKERIDRALTRARKGHKVALALIDLDRFKNVNDRFGHLAGDELVREVAKRLTRLFNRVDGLARLGGDEFALVLEGKDLAQDIEPRLAKILTELQRPYEVLGNQAHIGASIGVAVAPDCGSERTELMRKADIALYRAKEDGRGCYRYFSEPMDDAVQYRAILEEDLRAALDGGEGLSVHYQPWIDPRKGEVAGLEALLRWNHGELGAISPQVFVSVAEEAGLIYELGDWVVENACEVARAWPELTIAINLSPLQFCDETFAERVCDIVRRAGVSPRQIEFEVTEGLMLEKDEVITRALHRLRQEGFRMALDDFGTGYSSLNYLRNFEVDRIKIDKSFVDSLELSDDASAIINAVVSLGHAMGLEVTAEGVETVKQRDFLCEIGCDQLQGHLFSEAVPASEIRALMRQLPHSTV